MQNPHEPLASGRISPSGAATPARSTPRPSMGSAALHWTLPQARTSSLLSARSGTWKAHFYQWLEFLNLGIWWVVIKYVTKSFVTFIGVLFFWSLWKCEDTWCYQAFLIRYSKLWNTEACNMSRGTKEFSYSWKIHLISSFPKPEHQRKCPMLCSLVIKKLYGLAKRAHRRTFL